MLKSDKLIFFICGILLIFNVYRALSKNWSLGDPIDFRGLYVQSLLFIDDEEIYNDSIAHNYWNKIEAQEEFDSPTDLGDKFYSIMLYPPQTSIQLYFLKLFSWKQARIFWWIVCFLSLGFILYFLRDTNLGLLALALVFAYKGTFSALSLGQPLLPVFACILFAIQLRKSRPLISGFFLGLALLKFSIVIPFAIWFLAQKNYKPLITMCVTGLILLMPVLVQNPLVIQEFFNKVDEYYVLIYTPHILNIYTFSNSELTIMLDYYFNADVQIWKISNMLAQILGFTLIIWLYIKKNLDLNVFLLGLLLVSFLFSYHLTYDALLLLLPLAMLSRSYHLSTYGIWWFILLSLPINAVFGEGSIFSFHYPILVMIALIYYIFASFKNSFEIKPTNITT